MKLFLKLSLVLFLIGSCGAKDEKTNFSPEKTVQETDTLSPQNNIPKQENEGPSGNLMSFIPKNYELLDTTSGDLNQDAYPDMILVLKKTGEEKTSNVVDHPEKRPLLILIAKADKTYQLAGSNDNTVYCVDCGGVMGDPFTGVSIKKGYFSVEHYGGSSWRWTRIITYKYSKEDKNWFLYKDGSDNYHASDPENVETKVRTVKDFGKVAFSAFNIYEEEGE